MSSPTRTPIYVPAQRRRSLVGPVLLIGIGLLFLLHNLGMRMPTFELFARFWPVVLILAGLVKIFEHFQAQRSGDSEPRLGGGAVFLLIMIVLFGTGASAAYHNRDKINWGEVRDEVQMDEGFWQMFGGQYTYDGETTQPVPDAVNAVKFEGERGDITVSAWDQKEVKVVWHKRIFASNQSQAEETNQKTNPAIAVNGNVLSVSSNTQGNGPKGVTTNVEVFLPRKLALEINTRRGDVTVSGRDGDLKLDLGHGDVIANDIVGNLTMTARKGSLRAEKITGNVAIDGRGDDLTLNEVGGVVTLSGDFFGDIRLSKIAKGIRLNSSRTDLEIAKIDGEVTLDTGDLNATGVQGPVVVDTRSKDIKLQAVNGDVRINTEAGDISIEAAEKLPLGNIEVNSRRGDITVDIPAKAAFEMAATARHGDVTSDFGEIRIENSQHDASSGTGVVGKGGPKVKLESGAGQIRIARLVGGSSFDANATPATTGAAPAAPKAKPKAPAAPAPSE